VRYGTAAEFVVNTNVGLDSQESSMGQVLIRNIDDRKIERLRLRAELKGHSLEQELREIINQAAGPTVEERLAMIDRVRAMQKKPSRLLSENVIREQRDERIRKLTGKRA
jgi:plasmid stability protein